MIVWLNTKNRAVFILLSLAFILRFFNFWDWSLTNDELSAMMRTDYNSIATLFNEGIWVDGHPALTQVFLFYWRKLFGTSVFWWRLPFVIFSCIGVVYFYLFAKKILNKNAAIVALAFISVSQLFILYSQIARPYSLGFFFTMVFSYYWYVFIKEKQTWKYLFIVALIGALGAITHYFSSLSILLLTLSGFFIISKMYFKRYVFMSFLMFLFYAPHLPITFNHITIGGVEWLAAPKADFIFDFFKYVFNDSIIFTAIGFSSILVGLLLNRKLNILKSIGLASIFILVYGIAYFYSVSQSPVLQFSVLIFSFPFFLLFLSSFFHENSNKKATYIFCSVVVLLGVFSLVFGTSFYGTKKFSDFKSVVQKSLTIKTSYGEKQLLSFSNSNNPEYLDYYFKQFNDTMNFSISSFYSLESIAAARDSVEKSNKEFVLTSFANAPIPAEVHELIKLKYPVIVEKHRFFNSEAKLYGRGANNRKKIVHTSFLDYSFNSKWNVATDFLEDSIFSSKAPSYKMLSEHEYVLNFKDTIKNLFQGKNNFLTIKAQIKAGSTQNFLLVCSVDRDGENISWRGTNVSPFLKENEWAQFLTVFQKTEEIQANDIVSIYFWNPEKSSAYIDEFEITNFEDSDYNYYE